MKSPGALMTICLLVIMVNNCFGGETDLQIKVNNGKWRRSASEYNDADLDESVELWRKTGKTEKDATRWDKEGQAETREEGIKMKAKERNVPSNQDHGEKSLFVTKAKTFRNNGLSDRGTTDRRVTVDEQMNKMRNGSKVSNRGLLKQGQKEIVDRISMEEHPDQIRRVNGQQNNADTASVDEIAENPENRIEENKQRVVGDRKNGIKPLVGDLYRTRMNPEPEGNWASITGLNENARNEYTEGFSERNLNEEKKSKEKPMKLIKLKDLEDTDKNLPVSIGTVQQNHMHSHEKETDDNNNLGDARSQTEKDESRQRKMYGKGSVREGTTFGSINKNNYKREGTNNGHSAYDLLDNQWNKDTNGNTIGKSEAENILKYRNIYSKNNEKLRTEIPKRPIREVVGWWGGQPGNPKPTILPTTIDTTTTTSNLIRIWAFFETRISPGNSQKLLRTNSTQNFTTGIKGKQKRDLFSFDQRAKVFNGSSGTTSMKSKNMTVKLGSQGKKEGILKKIKIEKTKEVWKYSHDKGKKNKTKGKRSLEEVIPSYNNADNFKKRSIEVWEYGQNVEPLNRTSDGDVKIGRKFVRIQNTDNGIAGRHKRDSASAHAHSYQDGNYSSENDWIGMENSDIEIEGGNATSTTAISETHETTTTITTTKRASRRISIESLEAGEAAATSYGHDNSSLDIDSTSRKKRSSRNYFSRDWGNETWTQKDGYDSEFNASLVDSTNGSWNTSDLGEEYASNLLQRNTPNPVSTLYQIQPVRSRRQLIELKKKKKKKSKKKKTKKKKKSKKKKKKKKSKKKTTPSDVANWSGSVDAKSSWNAHFHIPKCWLDCTTDDP